MKVELSKEDSHNLSIYPELYFYIQDYINVASYVKVSVEKDVYLLYLQSMYKLRGKVTVRDIKRALNNFHKQVGRIQKKAKLEGIFESDYTRCYKLI